MGRIARIVVPGVPHHVTQRGNRGEAIFFEDGQVARSSFLKSQNDLEKAVPRSSRSLR
jgi:hypothetical protein